MTPTTIYATSIHLALGQLAKEGSPLRIADYQILKVIQMSGPETLLRDIAANLDMSLAGFSLACDRLEKLGYLKPGKHAKDKRRIVYTLTPAFTALCNKLDMALAAATQMDYEVDDIGNVVTNVLPRELDAALLASFGEGIVPVVEEAPVVEEESEPDDEKAPESEEESEAEEEEEESDEEESDEEEEEESDEESDEESYEESDDEEEESDDEEEESDDEEDESDEESDDEEEEKPAPESDDEEEESDDEEWEDEDDEEWEDEDDK